MERNIHLRKDAPKMNVRANVVLESADALEARLREIGATRYHNRHPFHRLLHGGQLSRGQIQAWALNRYYYQCSIPIKDAFVLTKLRDRSVRREWLHRITDHDGEPGDEGGIDRWLKLTDFLGLDRDYVVSTEGILPATRFAVDAYVNFVRDGSPLEAVGSSLTELFAPSIHQERIAGLLANYDFFTDEVLAYFRRRLHQAPRDAGFALRYVRENANTPEERDAVCRALLFKTDVLWVQLDALQHAYVEGNLPPGAFVPEHQIKITAAR
jgi:pyrroloquinoline-quinone synthase